MPSKLRTFIVLNGGNCYTGKAAVDLVKKSLRYIHYDKGKPWPEAVANFKAYGPECSVWVFRDKRGLDIKRSNYRRMCNYFGVGMDANKRPRLYAPPAAPMRRDPIADQLREGAMPVGRAGNPLPGRQQQAAVVLEMAREAERFWRVEADERA